MAGHSGASTGLSPRGRLVGGADQGGERAEQVLEEGAARCAGRQGAAKVVEAGPIGGRGLHRSALAESLKSRINDQRQSGDEKAHEHTPRRGRPFPDERHDGIRTIGANRTRSRVHPAREDS